MRFKKMLSKIGLQSNVDSPQPVSMILLLRKSHFFDEAEIRLAAEKAWGVSFDVDEDARNYVVNQGM